MHASFTFPGDTRVEGRVGSFTVLTDQPPDASAPTPFTLFLMSIGACAAYYVLAFCRQRGISTEGICVVQDTDAGASGLVERIALTIELPPEFPEKYRAAVIRAAEQCSVKKHLESPPVVTIETQVLAGA